MLTSIVAILHDNTAHGEENYLVRKLSHHAFLDAVMDGGTGRGGREASQEVVNALADTSLTSPEAVVAVLEEIYRAEVDIEPYDRLVLVTDGIISVV